jgi:hypothetical protein
MIQANELRIGNEVNMGTVNGIVKEENGFKILINDFWCYPEQLKPLSITRNRLWSCGFRYSEYNIETDIYKVTHKQFFELEGVSGFNGYMDWYLNVIGDKQDPPHMTMELYLIEYSSLLLYDLKTQKLHLRSDGEVASRLIQGIHNLQNIYFSIMNEELEFKN